MISFSSQSFTRSKDTPSFDKILLIASVAFAISFPSKVETSTTFFLPLEIISIAFYKSNLEFATSLENELSCNTAIFFML